MPVGVLSPGIERLGHEADHSPSSSVEVRNEWSFICTSLDIFMAWKITTLRETFTVFMQSRIVWDLNIVNVRL
jgi:hypothetical protein